MEGWGIALEAPRAKHTADYNHKYGNVYSVASRTGTEKPLLSRGEAFGETHPNEHKDEHGDKVVSTGDRVLVGQAEQVHDGGAHAEDALDLVARRLVGVDGPDLGLSGRPGGLLQVDLRRGRRKLRGQNGFQQRRRRRR